MKAFCDCCGIEAIAQRDTWFNFDTGEREETFFPPIGWQSFYDRPTGEMRLCCTEDECYIREWTRNVPNRVIEGVCKVGAIRRGKGQVKIPGKIKKELLESRGMLESKQEKGNQHHDQWQNLGELFKK